MTDQEARNLLNVGSLVSLLVAIIGGFWWWYIPLIVFLLV